MSVATVFTRGALGVNAPLVTVETHLSNGLPKFLMVGLPEAAVKESKDRVRSALINSGFEFPIRHITVNLAPADLPKEGGRFDLAIAISILVASNQIRIPNLDMYEFAGELGLLGEIRKFSGALPFAVQTYKAGRSLFIAADNAKEAALSQSNAVFGVKHFIDLCAHFMGKHTLLPVENAPAPQTSTSDLDLSDVVGQTHARRALEIAAAGGHSLLMSGPPGTGKTMLASRLSSIMPDLSVHEALDVASIASLSTGGFDSNQFGKRPFRAPHHTASAVSLVGGGSSPRPGEISLAHHGVLFLDELPEFDRKVIEVLREPLESGSITIARAARTLVFPARFQLIAAMNPCPCGYASHPSRPCRCTPAQIERYRGKLSGPLLDRIDMHIEVPALPSSVMINAQQVKPAEPSHVVKQRVIAALAYQTERQQCFNAALNNAHIKKYCDLSPENQNLLENAVTQLGFSARAYHKILKVARTIADLSQKAHIETPHLLEALQFRKFDRYAFKAVEHVT